MKITLDIEGQRELIAAFEIVEKGMLDLRQLGTWDWVQSEYYKVVKGQFDSEGAGGKSGKWQPLSPKYAKAKQRRYGNRPILQATSQMYRAMTSQATGSVVEKKAQEMTISTSLKYPVFHQRGTRRMPQRKIIDFTDEQKKQILKPIQTKLKQLIANAKLRDIRGF